ncbi:MAG: FAD-binding oxidoreductase [Firmicutes bacterium]|nr:FAD-binding oxidoreductase [Bacillota bacterium]
MSKKDKDFRLTWQAEAPKHKTHKPYKGFKPEFDVKDPEAGTYRSIFKWGAQDFHKIPKEGLLKLIKERFGMTDEDFKKRLPNDGHEKVEYDIPLKLTAKQLSALEAIVGKDNIKTDDYTRLSVAYGKTMFDLLRLRNKIVENVPDAVLYPAETEQIEKIVEFCNKERIPVYVYGGGSSVTRGVECVKGGISLDLRKNFNKVVKFNKVNQTVTVQAGMMGPALEEYLNMLPLTDGTKYAYTCGHFPQSYKWSSVGGWVVTRGAGQNSTYFGKIENIVMHQKYATPIGVIETDSIPAKATGPDIGQIMMGAEGTFGVLTEVTLRVFRLMEDNQFRFGFMFRTWQDAQAFGREVMQCQAGFPSVFRLSDGEETEMMMYNYNLDEMKPVMALLKMKGYELGKMSLCLGFTDGEKGFCKNVLKNVKKLAKQYGGMSLTGVVTKEWEKGRFTDPYLRDTVQDFGIMIETLECAMNWDNMNHVWEYVRNYCKSRPNTIVCTHISHAYPQGANLYFIFIAKMTEMEEFKAYHSGLLQAIHDSGAAMSHHHGIGKMFAPWLRTSVLGESQHDIIKALRKHFDPNCIMNPGGTLGLD